MQKNSDKEANRFTMAEAFALAFCLIAIALLLALHRYRPRNDYAVPEKYQAVEAASSDVNSTQDADLP